MIVGYAYANFQKMFQRVVNMAWVMDETEVENKKMSQTKRKFGPGGSSSQGNRNFRRFNPERTLNKGKQPAQWQERKLCDQCGRQHLGPCRGAPGHCFGFREMGHKVPKCPKVTWNNQSNTQRLGIESQPATP